MISVTDFIEVMRSEGASQSSIRSATLTLTQLSECKPLEEISYMDIVKFINKIRDVHNYKESTISLRKAYIKKYFRANDRDDISSKLEVKRVPRHLNPNDILKPEDIEYLLKHMDSPLYKAIISFLYETGARINECLNVKLKDDIKEVEIGYDLTLYGSKTREHNHAYREMYLIDSAPYIHEYLMYRLESGPYLFPVSDRAVGVWLSNLKKTLNFSKPINPHAFRHACATRLVREGMQESLIRKQLGWSANSNMISVYVHLANTDLKKYQTQTIPNSKQHHY